MIQDIIRAGYGRVQACYSDGLGRKPKLAGKIVTRFTIELTGKVSKASADPESTMPDQAVVGCVVEAFYDFSFPPPTGGAVTVVFPIALSPG